MSTHEEMIHQLLTLQDQSHNGDVLLSLYLPIGATLPSDLKTKLRALIIANLRADDKSRQYSTAHQRLADYLVERVLELTPLPKSLGLFARLTIAKIDQATSRTFSDFISYQIVPLTAEVAPAVFVGQVFDLLPLFQLDRKSIHALVVLLDNQQGLLYQLVDDQLTKVKTIENVWAYLGENEAHSVKSLGQAGAIAHGTGYDKVQRTQESGNEMVLNMLVKELKPYLTPSSPWKQIVIFAGPNFNTMLNKWLADLQKLTPIEPIMSNFTPGTDPQIMAKAVELIQQQQHHHLQQLHSQYQQEYHQWATGWHEVTEAVRRRQVATLLITPRATHEGYVLYNELPYTQPQAESQHVHNLAPWLTKIVYQSHGRVIASNQLPRWYQEPIVARLRYKPT